MEQEQLNYDRRRFVLGLTALMGSAFITSNALAIDAAIAYQGGARSKVLSAKQLDLVRLIGEIIIPETDTPGAMAADVHGFIDYMVAEFMTPQAQQDFVAALNQIDASAGDFLALHQDKQVAFVEQLDKDAFAPGSSWKTHGPYRSLKSWVTTGYYSSEIGMTQFQNYHPLPGPLQEVSYDQWLSYNGWS